MEKEKWQSIDEDIIIPNDVWYASSIRSWPQSIGNKCWDEEVLVSLEERPFGLRIHSVDGRVNYHSFMISNDPPIRSYAPWGFGSDDWDQIWLRRSCSR